MIRVYRPSFESLFFFLTNLVLPDRIFLNIYMRREVQKRRSNRPNRQDRPTLTKAEEAMDCCEELTVSS